MVSVAQLVESRIVIPVVVGSSPIVHPILKMRLRTSLNLIGNKARSMRAFCYDRHIASVAKLVYALDLGSSGATRGSSSLPTRTIFLF